MGTASVLAFAGGITLTVVSNNASAQLKSGYHDRATATSLLNTEQTTARLAWVSYGVAGVTAAGAIAAFFLAPVETSGPRMSLAITPSGMFAATSLRF
jgi:hypothetical protein